jgi:RimJ/RimL family protein N-acetyltransferase
MFDSIITSRLELRRPTMSDLAALVERRNDPSVAKYQDWPLPFELDSARQLLAGAAKMPGPTRGQWRMVTVVDRERPAAAPLGDLAVHLSEDGREAEIGYTFAVVSQGRGYATEAVGALVDYLFEDVAVSGCRPRFTRTTWRRPWC